MKREEKGGSLIECDECFLSNEFMLKFDLMIMISILQNGFQTISCFFR